MKVRVINRMQQYRDYKEFASKYAKGCFWFDNGYKIKDDDVLELIEYAPHKEFKDETIAVCKDNENRIILIEKRGVKEMKENVKVLVVDWGRLYTTFKEIAKKYIGDELWFEDGYSAQEGDILELIEYTPHIYNDNITMAVCKDEKNRIILIGEKGIIELKKQVRVVDDGYQYCSYSDLANKYTNDVLWFEEDYSVEKGEVLNLITITKHPNFKDKEIAVCKDDKNRIILIGIKGIKDVETKKDEEKAMKTEIKVGDICEVVNGWGMSFQQLGTKVRVLEINKYVDHNTTNTTARIEKLDDGTIGSCYLTSIKLVEKEPILPVGTRVMVVKDILSAEEFTGKEFVIEESNEYFAVAKKYFESYDFILAVNPFHLENGYVVVLEDKKVEKWSEWKYDGSRHFYYRVKGNRIQAKKYGIKVQSKCLDCDTFDLKKGLKICNARIEIKEAQEQLKELCK